MDEKLSKFRDYLLEWRTVVIGGESGFDLSVVIVDLIDEFDERFGA